METRNKEMEEIKDEFEKIKAAASRTITSHWLVQPCSHEQKVELLEEGRKMSSSSDSQEIPGDIDVVVNDNYKFIILRNWSDQDKPLGGRQLKVQINNSEPITYTFDPSLEVKAGDIAILYGPGYNPVYVLSGYLVREDLESWWPGDRVQVSLQ
ncbi:prelamin-A/C-like [Mugil cephalus]|uniref:prelamin-A/C-like n=1 Tax=Mugil cephalus TaxID=48193 RepID=UPI001FB73481|nr:prelamin-A/C-like [Mugil cephalus]